MLVLVSGLVCECMCVSAGTYCIVGPDKLITLPRYRYSPVITILLPFPLNTFQVRSCSLAKYYISRQGYSQARHVVNQRLLLHILASAGMFGYKIICVIKL